ncbi:hypothetical protein M404DRAFT_373997 [Pisolithus tinctorius Marx 270]|uniref:Uncharacterized protein n=1 Tax=Pisolithus tinctorius Marx 270 TaxID=870435 RepID=A0A0C3NFU0_PISTI|nr:hypothetical protein M404DRAFT_373997 [Pisolithus tinctorius Marx 270]
MPSVAEDVCKAQQCEADDMLEYILNASTKFCPYVMGTPKILRDSRSRISGRLS